MENKREHLFNMWINLEIIMEGFKGAIQNPLEEQDISKVIEIFENHKSEFEVEYNKLVEDTLNYLKQKEEDSLSEPECIYCGDTGFIRIRINPACSSNADEPLYDEKITCEECGGNKNG